MIPAKELHTLSQRLKNAVNKPHKDALLDSLLFLEHSRTKQAMEFTRFVLDLYHNDHINMQPLKGFSSEVRGWCISWIGAYMRGELNQYHNQIQEAYVSWFDVDMLGRG